MTDATARRKSGPKPRPVLDRLRAKTPSMKPEDCWVFNGSIDSGGYTRIVYHGKVSLVHRVSYIEHYGPIPEGLQIDHVKARGCVSRACWNPAHLEAVTPRVNNLRSTNFAAQRAAQTECLRGHAFDAANTYVRPNGTRGCRACTRERGRELRRAARGD